MSINPKLKLLSASVMAFCLTSTVATAENNGFVFKANDNPNATLNYWTPERLQNAKPRALPKINPAKLSKISIIPEEESISQEGAPPTISLKPAKDLLFNGEPNVGDQSKTPNDVGTSGVHFSSSRLVPLTADLSYPYSAVGKLFFTVPSEGNFVCSASVIANRLVVTAGHCVHEGSGGAGGYFTNFLFVPAYRDGNAPFQRWTWSFVATSTAWMTGGGDVPNAGDWGILEMKDNVVSGVTRTIGSVAGKLGFATNKLAQNHLHLLGYPCNFDSCQKMHQVTSANGDLDAPNNVQYGSDMTGGSSGGPWVQNFGVRSVGQTGGLNPAFNQVVGVTSWGFVSPNPKVQGASNFNNSFATLFSTMCAHRAGNC